MKFCDYEYAKCLLKNFFQGLEKFVNPKHTRYASQKRHNIHSNISSSVRYAYSIYRVKLLKQIDVILETGKVICFLNTQIERTLCFKF